MKILVLWLMTISCLSYANFPGANPVGGIYSSQGSAAVARVDDETSPFINPAGLGQIRASSISSGASSYSALKAQREDQNGIRTTSTTSHVSYIESFSNYNIGFMVYTLNDDQTQKTNFKRYTNSENYESYFYNNSTEAQNTLMYILSFAPKESNWGVSFNLYDLNYTFLTSTGRHSYFLTNFNDRSWATSVFETQIKVRLISATIGQQFKYKNFRFGYKLESPSYLIGNESSQRVNMLNVFPSGQNDALVFANNNQTDLEIESGKYIAERITLGVSFVEQKFTYEFNLFMQAASQNQYLNQKDATSSYSWFSQTDTYTIDKNNSENGGGDYVKAEIIPSIGIEFRPTDKETFGAGAFYTRTSQKDLTGTNSVTLTAGYAKQFKNFLGSYTLLYRREFDTGHNTTSDYETGEDVKLDLSTESLSLVFGGSYSF